MAFFTRRDNTYHLITTTTPDLHAQVPPGIYTVQLDDMTGFYLEMLPVFTLPDHRYGANDTLARRILQTFHDRPGTTGVLLSGEKGSGKSLLAKTLSVMNLEQGIPTLVINSPYDDDKFKGFLQAITQPCMVLFDEFEKVYDSKEQKALLTLFDGVFSGKKLFVLTTNDLYEINGHMHNRPGRFYYLLEFHGVETAFVEEYCQAMLQEQRYLTSIVQIARCYPQFNFDMLQALVEEMNRYQESPQEALAYLNIKPNKRDEREYTVSLRVHGVPKSPVSPRIWEGNPISLQGRINIEYGVFTEAGEQEWGDAYFSETDLQTINQHGVVYYKNSHGEELLLKPLPQVKSSYLSLLNGHQRDLVDF